MGLGRGFLGTCPGKKLRFFSLGFWHNADPMVTREDPGRLERGSLAFL
jgi:hypothetical protein